MTRRKPGTSPEDLSLWEGLTRSISPLKARSDRLAPPVQPLPRRGVLPDIPGASEPRAPSSRWPEVPGLSVPGLAAGDPEDQLFRKTFEPLESGRLHGMDAKTADRLRKGRLPVDSALDLHGMTQAEAEAALQAFVRRGWDSGWRSVLVVTGRGGYRAGQGGILRQRLPDWLNSAPMRPFVVGFTQAQQKDGGSGAFYVRLRRKR
ncbi:Smr/MutS family protein [Phaeovibrio sulfidiphilus]|uniref:Smr/MutS family protein n=1 Tax=Phaeovibrio sulfidiphilus TaxID=1220600 RepID=A0A8J6YLY3_9PROT|nr:Smr/MutS family protein [Phaeovibrio sulfidiphilus]MBE1236845.1 Smr/MutS family protein [Phaeovibrio sulfidiphilus]